MRANTNHSKPAEEFVGWLCAIFILVVLMADLSAYIAPERTAPSLRQGVSR